MSVRCRPRRLRLLLVSRFAALAAGLRARADRGPIARPAGVHTQLRRGSALAARLASCRSRAARPAHRLPPRAASATAGRASTAATRATGSSARDLRAKSLPQQRRAVRRAQRPPRRSLHVDRRSTFVRGGASEVDIDHRRRPGRRVAEGRPALAAARARRLRQRSAEPARRRRAPANRQKGDGDAATWLPANKARSAAAYVARQVSVKLKYALVGHGRRARRDAPRPGAAARSRCASLRTGGASRTSDGRRARR